MTLVCRETSKQRGEEGINEAAGVCSVKQRFRWKAVIMMLRVRAVTWLGHKNLSDEYIYYFAHQLFMQEKVSIKCVLRGFSFPQTVSVFITRFFHQPSDVHRNKPGFWVLLLLQVFVQQKRKKTRLGYTLTTIPLVLFSRTNNSSTHWFLVTWFDSFQLYILVYWKKWCSTFKCSIGLAFS